MPFSSAARPLSADGIETRRELFYQQEALSLSAATVLQNVIKFSQRDKKKKEKPPNTDLVGCHAKIGAQGVLHDAASSVNIKSSYLLQITLECEPKISAAVIVSGQWSEMPGNPRPRKKGVTERRRGGKWTGVCLIFSSLRWKLKFIIFCSFLKLLCTHFTIKAWPQHKPYFIHVNI